MAISFACEKCHRRYRANDSARGKSVECANCHEQVVIEGLTVPNHDVFVSHSSKDKIIADAIVAAMEARKIRCWVAPRDVPAGAKWGEAIVEGIENSRVMVMIYSENSNVSDHVLREIERAASKQIVILPYRLDATPMSKSLEFFLSACHWLDAMTPPLESHIQELVESTVAILRRLNAPASPSASVASSGISAFTIQSEHYTINRHRHHVASKLGIIVSCVCMLLVGLVVHLIWNRSSSVGVAPSQSTTEVQTPEALDDSRSSMNTVDVLKAIDLGRDAVSGTWTMNEGSLIGSADVRARVMLPVVPPPAYDMEMDIERISDWDQCGVILVCGGRQVQVCLGARIGGKSGNFTCIEMVDGHGAGEDNPTLVRRELLPHGIRQTIRCEVREASITLFRGLERILHWEGNPKALQLHGSLLLPRQDQLAFTTYQGKYRISRVELTPVSEPATTLAKRIARKELPPTITKSSASPSTISSGTDYSSIATGKWLRLIEPTTPLPNPQNMKFANGGVEISEGGFNFHQIHAKNILVRAKVKKISGGPLSLGLRNNNANGATSRYTAYFDGDGQFGIGKAGKKNWTELKDVKTGEGKPEFFEMVFSAIDDKFTIYVDGKKHLTATDVENTESGFAHVFTKGVAAFKDVEVMILDPHKEHGDLFQAGTKWIAKDTQGKAVSEFEILKRSGNEMDVRYQGTSNVIQAKGQVTKLGIQWLHKDVTKVEKGKAFKAEVTQIVGHEQCRLNWEVSSSNRGTVLLALDKGAPNANTATSNFDGDVLPKLQDTDGDMSVSSTPLPFESGQGRAVVQFNADDLAAGKIKAPSLQGVKPIYDDDFSSSKLNGLAVISDKGRAKSFFQAGTYRIESGGSWAYRTMDRPPPMSDIAVQLRMKTEEKLYYATYIIAKPGGDFGLEVLVSGDRKLRLKPRANSDTRAQIEVTHTAIKPAPELNDVLLILRRNRRVETYVNGVAVCQPIDWQNELSGLQFRPGFSSQKKGNAKVAFDHITVWPASSIPSVEARASKGEFRLVQGSPAQNDVRKP